jgi:hypothetical protein
VELTARRAIFDGWRAAVLLEPLPAAREYVIIENTLIAFKPYSIEGTISGAPTMTDYVIASALGLSVRTNCCVTALRPVCW